MATLALIKEALADIKDRNGSSVIALNKWIEANKKVCPLRIVYDCFWDHHGPRSKGRFRAEISLF